MASASESQTDAGDGADEDSTASEREGSLRRGMLGEGLMDARDGRRRGLAGDSGRGEHVLIGRRLSPRSEALADRRLSWDGLRSGTWGSALFEALEAHAPKRRTSPAPRPLRPARGRPLRPPEPPIPRAPTPPLTIDDIAASSFNPFPLFHIRVHLIPEVVLLVTAFLFAVFRLYTISPTAAYPTISPLPLASLAFLALATPFLALFRRPDSYFKAPFTDERGYRDQAAADDGIATAILLPLLLAAACYWDTYSSSSGGGAAVGLGGIRPFMDIWEAAGIHAKSKLGAFNPAVLSTPFALARGLLQARHELVLLTSLNAVVLLVHLALSRTLLRIEKLPKNNTKRFFGFMAVSGGISLAVYVGLAVWDWTARGVFASPQGSGSRANMNCRGASNFSCRGRRVDLHPAVVLLHRLSARPAWLHSRRAQHDDGGGERSLFGVLATLSITSAFSLLDVGITDSRSFPQWLYKRGYPSVPPTFRSPTPILAFQSVLIPGAFLSGFLLSPLLVISRHIASKPSHRLKVRSALPPLWSLADSACSQWPGERERHRRVLAAGVFLGLFGIVFGMLGGWAGWMLGGGLRRPWTWAVTLVFYGGDGVPSLVPIHGWQRWKRLVLVAYWAGTIVVAVGGWQTRLVRARRIRMRNGASKGSGSEMSKGKESAKVGAEQAREDKRVHASLNMRRKFFHALAVMMFVPGIAVDVRSSSLSCSRAS